MSDFPAEYSATLASYDGKIETCKLWKECQAIVDWLLIDCESPRSEAEVVTAFLSWPIASKRIFMSVLGDEEYQVKSDELKNAINQNILDENQYVASTAQMCSFSCCSPVFTMKIGKSRGCWSVIRAGTDPESGGLLAPIIKQEISALAAT